MNSFVSKTHDANPNSRDIEDCGLFKTQLSRTKVQVVLNMSNNQRGDIVLRGFAENETPIELLFAGRRTAIAAPLINILKQRWSHIQKYTQRDSDKLATDKVRQPVEILGCWRPRFEKDDQGWVTRSYQLVVAQWSVIDSTGKERTYGASPQNAYPTQVAKG